MDATCFPSTCVGIHVCLFVWGERVNEKVKRREKVHVCEYMNLKVSVCMCISYTHVQTCMHKKSHRYKHFYRSLCVVFACARACTDLRGCVLCMYACVTSTATVPELTNHILEPFRRPESPVRNTYSSRGNVCSKA